MTAFRLFPKSYLQRTLIIIIVVFNIINYGVPIRANICFSGKISTSSRNSSTNRIATLYTLIMTYWFYYIFFSKEYKLLDISFPIIFLSNAPI